MYQENDDYVCGRDHDRGPGAWSVQGPNDFNMPVPDRSIGITIATFMSGRYQAATEEMREWRKMVKDDPNWFKACNGRFEPHPEQEGT